MMEKDLENVYTVWGQAYEALTYIVFTVPEKRAKAFRLVHQLVDDLSALTKDDSSNLECTEPADPDSQTQQEVRDDDETQCEEEVAGTLSNVGKCLQGGQPLFRPCETGGYGSKAQSDDEMYDSDSDGQLSPSFFR